MFKSVAEKLRKELKEIKVRSGANHLKLIFEFPTRNEKGILKLIQYLLDKSIPFLVMYSGMDCTIRIETTMLDITDQKIISSKIIEVINGDGEND